MLIRQTTQRENSRSTRAMSKLMLNRLSQETASTVATLDDLAQLANYSLMDTLNCDPDAKANGADHAPRQVFTGHYVPVNPTPIKDPSTSRTAKTFFANLASPTAWRSRPTLSACSPATSRRFRSRCARLVGPVGTHFHLRHRILPTVPVPNRQRIRGRSRSFCA